MTLLIKQRYFSKLQEWHKIFFDRDWVIKIYQNNFDRFHDDMYWEIINYLPINKLEVLRVETYQRLYYSILPFPVWNHIWCCCRSQYDPSICQFCSKLLIKNKKVDKEIRKRLTFDSGLVSLFFHVKCGPDRQKPYSLVLRFYCENFI